MFCWAAAAPVTGSALSHCAPPKAVVQALQSDGGASQTVVHGAAASCSARRVPARLVISAANWLPAEMASDWATLALSPARTESDEGIWPAVRLNRAGMEASPGPALKALSRARATESWLAPRPGVAAIADCRFSTTSVAA